MSRCGLGLGASDRAGTTLNGLARVGRRSGATALGCCLLVAAASAAVPGTGAKDGAQPELVRVVLDGLSEDQPPAGSFLLLRRLGLRLEELSTTTIEGRTVPVETAVVEVEVPPGTWWQVEGAIPGHWLVPAAFGAGGGEVRLRVVPTGVVRVAAAVPRGDVSPEQLGVLFAEANHEDLLRFGAEPVRAPHDLLSGEGACRREEPPLWRCEIPAAGPLDLRFYAPGFASVFRRGVAAIAGEAVDLGRLTLIPGGSVIGWVDLPPGGVLEPGAVEVALAPESLDPWDPEVRLQERIARLKGDGRFQYRELEPGIYRTTVRARGWATAGQGSIEVLAGRETELSRPLAIEPPATLEVCLRPGDPPGFRPGDTWAPVLHAEGGARRAPRAPVPGCLADPGCYLWSDVPPGAYRLVIGDGRASMWWQGGLSLVPGETRLDQELPLVPVHGRLTRGGEPVRARLVFRKVLPGAGEQLAGERKIVLYSGPQGTFDGALPAEGRWWVTVAFGTAGAERPLGPVVVERAEDGGAALDLLIAATRLWGRVVGANGEGIGSAQVEISPLPIDEEAGSAAVGRTVADERGHFEFTGLASGRYRVTARSRGRSAAAEIEVRDASSPALKLVIPEGSIVSGRVVSPRGPVIGTAVVAYPQFQPQRSEPPFSAVADFTGEFALPVPAEATALTLLVLPPGHAARLLRVTPGRDPLVVPADTVGGTLVLRAGEGDGGLDGARLVAEGASVELAALNGWSRALGGGSSDRLWTLPSMSVGEYSLCAASEVCDRGLLKPHGTLVLRLPDMGP